MKDQELINLLKQQAKEIANANIAGWGNTMTEAANRFEQLVSKATSDREKTIILAERLRCAMVELEHEKQCYKDIFDYWNEKYPDEMNEYLDK